MQASPHADGALHPDLRPGLRDAAGGDPTGHSLQHQEVQWAGGQASKWAGRWVGRQAHGLHSTPYTVKMKLVCRDVSRFP